jgi:hypothetical protein
MHSYVSAISRFLVSNMASSHAFSAGAIDSTCTHTRISAPIPTARPFEAPRAAMQASHRRFILAAVILIGSLLPLAANCQIVDPGAATTAAQAPTISPAAGTYYSAKTITMTSPTPGAYFHYTIDGTTPSLSSPWYGGPFTIPGDRHIKVQAIAYAYGYNPSSVASSVYLDILPAQAPTISPVAGTYDSPRTVTLTSSTPGVYYHYTTDGTTPTISSTWYAGPFTVSANQTVKAVAFAYNYTESNVASSTYTITPPAAAPVISPASGTYKTVQTVTMSDATPGAAIYYTTDGTLPTASSTRYTGPIKVGASHNFFAKALAPGGSLGAVTKTYVTIVLPTATPVVSPAEGTYNKIQSVTLTDATPGATIYYTTDGSYPTTSSAKYSAPITATTGMQITAFATAPDYSVGAGIEAMYTIIAPPPTITPASGTMQNTATVTMTDAVAGATIHYTRDGSIPSTSSPVYTGPIALSPAETTAEVYQAIATAPGYLQSASRTASFTVDLAAGVLAQTTVGTTPTKSIPPNFMGLSTNWTQPPLMMGQASTGVNTAYRTLLKNLLETSTAPMLIRIPGDDSSVADIQAAAGPLAELAQAVNVNYTLGVDLWNNNLSLAQAETSAWMTGIPNNLIQAIEIGNEPDVYPYIGARPSNYTWSEYLSEFWQWQHGINSTTEGNFNVMGPSMGGETNWVPSTEAVLTNGTLTADIVSQHAYLGGLTQASGAAWPADYLLRPNAATEFPVLFTGFAASAHKAGRLFRMDEIGSFFDGGVAGISDTFSSSLWSIDTMFNFVKDGMDGVNWISGQGTQYELFEFHPKTVNGTTTFSVTQVAPMYYGLLVFSEMAGNNAKLLPATTSTSANVSIWATVDDTSTAHVVVINKDEHATGDVQITLPGYSSGTVRYLTAAGYSATNGLTLGGQTFDGTPDGRIQGSLLTTTITPTNGVFTLRDMPITCAAVIDFSK